MATLSLRSVVRLLDGSTIPVLGLGTFRAEGDECILALKHGYRMLDNATWYKNARGVATAIRNSSLERKDIFITTKVWNTEHGRLKTIQALNESLTK